MATDPEQLCMKNINYTRIRLIEEILTLMFRSSHIFVFWFSVFWSLQLHDFFFIFFHLVHLALQNVNKDYIIFLYFCNFVTKSDQKPKMKWDKQNIKIVSIFVVVAIRKKKRPGSIFSFQIRTTTKISGDIGCLVFSHRLMQ